MIPAPYFLPPPLFRHAFPHVMGRFPSRDYARCVSNQDASHPLQNQGLNFFTSLWGAAGAAAALAGFPAVLQGCFLCSGCQGRAVQLFQRHGRGIRGSFPIAAGLLCGFFAGSCAAPARWDRQNLERKDINSKTRAIATAGS